VDIQLSCFESFKRHKTDTTISTMAAVTVVVNFNIFEHGVAHLFTSGEVFTVDGFHFHSVKETFSTGIVLAVAFGAHTANQLVFHHETLVYGRTILTATI
jgi:hypothetical protein